jgi:hypothetical protein
MKLDITALKNQIIEGLKGGGINNSATYKGGHYDMGHQALVNGGNTLTVATMFWQMAKTLAPAFSSKDLTDIIIEGFSTQHTYHASATSQGGFPTEPSLDTKELYADIREFIVSQQSRFTDRDVSRLQQAGIISRDTVDGLAAGGPQKRADMQRGKP